MRKLLQLVRLVPLAVAAYASVATSPMRNGGYDVVSVSPGLGETAVPADVVPEVHFDPSGTEPGDAPHGLELLDASGQLVAGSSDRTDVDGEIVLRFYADAPLAPGSYTLQVTADATCTAPQLEDNAFCGASIEGQGRALASFSTVSKPGVIGVRPLYGKNGFTVYFSQDIDPATAELVHVRNVDGVELNATRTFQPGGTRVLDLSTPAGEHDVLLDDGILAADGTPIPGLPMVY